MESTTGALGEEAGVNIGDCSASTWGVSAALGTDGRIWEDWLSVIAVGEDIFEASPPHAPSAWANIAPPKTTAMILSRMV